MRLSTREAGIIVVYGLALGWMNLFFYLSAALRPPGHRRGAGVHRAADAGPGGLAARGGFRMDTHGCRRPVCFVTAWLIERIIRDGCRLCARRRPVLGDLYSIWQEGRRLARGRGDRPGDVDGGARHRAHRGCAGGRSPVLARNTAHGACRGGAVERASLFAGDVRHAPPADPDRGRPS